MAAHLADVMADWRVALMVGNWVAKMVGRRAATMAASTAGH